MYKKTTILKVLLVASLFLLSAPNVWAVPCQADIDCTGVVDLDDLAIMKMEFFDTPCNPCICIDPIYECPPGLKECDCTCVDNSTDENNCGTCGNICESGEICDNGTCVVPSPTCEGTLSTLGRWCDQLNGTVKDMTNEIVWLKDASWGGVKPWRNPCDNCSIPDNTCYDDAHRRAGILKDGTSGAGLSDGSLEGVWRLPTKTEMIALANGLEPVRRATPRFFINIPIGMDAFWSSTTSNTAIAYAYVVSTYNGNGFYQEKIWEQWVWPVRSAY